jgi:exosortase
MKNEASISGNPAQDADAERPDNRVWQYTLLSLFIGLAILSYGYIDTIIDTVSVWTEVSNYRLGWLVLPTMLLLLFFHRKQIQPITPKASWSGLFYGLIFVMFWIASDLLNISVLRQVALIGMIHALVFTATGGALYRILFPFLTLLLLAVPVWEVLLPALKSLALQFVSTYSKIAGIPLTSDGFALFVEGRRYVIIDYCAGLSYVLVGLLIGACYSLLTYRNYFKIALITLAAGCVAVVANGIRISSILSVEYFSGINLDNHHSLFDLPVIIPCFALFFFLLSRLKPGNFNNSGQLQERGDERPYLYSTILVVGTAILFSVAPQYMKTTNTQILLSPSPVNTGEEIAGWHSADKAPGWHPDIQSEEIREGSGVYRLGDTEILIYIAAPQRTDIKISGQAISLSDQNWMSYSQPKIEIFCDKTHCNDYGHLRSALRNSDRIRHIYFGYVINGRILSSTLKYRALRALANLMGNGASARYIAIVYEGKTGLQKEALVPLFLHLAHPGNSER